MLAINYWRIVGGGSLRRTGKLARDGAETVRSALDRDDAIRIARRELPDIAAAYAAGKLMPASTTRRRHQVELVRQHSDPSLELMRLTKAAITAEGLDVDAARRAVLKRDPVLARHYADATPLPMGMSARPAACIDDLVAAELAGYAKLQADIAELQRMTRTGHNPLNPGQRRLLQP